MLGVVGILVILSITVGFRLIDNLISAVTTASQKTKAQSMLSHFLKADARMRTQLQQYLVDTHVELVSADDLPWLSKHASQLLLNQMNSLGYRPIGLFYASTNRLTRVSVFIDKTRCSLACHWQTDTELWDEFLAFLPNGGVVVATNQFSYGDGSVPGWMRRRRKMHSNWKELYEWFMATEALKNGIEEIDDPKSRLEDLLNRRTTWFSEASDSDMTELAELASWFGKPIDARLRTDLQKRGYLRHQSLHTIEAIYLSESGISVAGWHELEPHVTYRYDECIAESLEHDLGDEMSEEEIQSLISSFSDLKGLNLYWQVIKASGIKNPPELVYSIKEPRVDVVRMLD